MKPTPVHRDRIKRVAPAVAFLCAAFAVVAATLPASAAQPQAAQTKIVTAAVTTGAANALPVNASLQPVVKSPAASAQCAPAPQRFDRTDSCTNAMGTIVFFVNRAPVGSIVFTLEQSIHLNTRSKDWIENDTITHLVSIKEVPDVVDIHMTAFCGSPCRASAHFGGVLRTGLRGTVSYTDNVGTNAVDETQTTYMLDVTAPGFLPGPPPVWRSALKYRCDKNMAVMGAGCVFPEFTPTLFLSHRAFGAAAYFIAWAQVMMHEHWGNPFAHGSPKLTRASAATGERTGAGSATVASTISELSSSMAARMTGIAATSSRSPLPARAVPRMAR